MYVYKKNVNGYSLSTSSIAYYIHHFLSKYERRYAEHKHCSSILILS